MLKIPGPASHDLGQHRLVGLQDAVGGVQGERGHHGHLNEDSGEKDGHQAPASQSVS
jgi:hypothetical protein